MRVIGLFKGENTQVKERAGVGCEWWIVGAGYARARLDACGFARARARVALGKGASGTVVWRVRVGSVWRMLGRGVWTQVGVDLNVSAGYEATGEAAGALCKGGVRASGWRTHHRSLAYGP